MMGYDCGDPICALCSYCTACKMYVDLLINDEVNAALEVKEEWIRLNPHNKERCEADKAEVARMIQAFRDSKDFDESTSDEAGRITRRYQTFARGGAVSSASGMGAQAAADPPVDVVQASAERFMEARKRQKTDQMSTAEQSASHPIPVEVGKASNYAPSMATWATDSDDDAQSVITHAASATTWHPDGPDGESSAGDFGNGEHASTVGDVDFDLESDYQRSDAVSIAAASTRAQADNTIYSETIVDDSNRARPLPGVALPKMPAMPPPPPPKAPAILTAAEPDGAKIGVKLPPGAKADEPLVKAPPIKGKGYQYQDIEIKAPPDQPQYTAKEKAAIEQYIDNNPIVIRPPRYAKKDPALPVGLLGGVKAPAKANTPPTSPPASPPSPPSASPPASPPAKSAASPKPAESTRSEIEANLHKAAQAIADEFTKRGTEESIRKTILEESARRTIASLSRSEASGSDSPQRDSVLPGQWLNTGRRSQSPPRQRARQNDGTETLAEYDNQGQLVAAARIEKILGLDIELLAEVVQRSATPLVESTVDAQRCLPGISSTGEALDQQRPWLEICENRHERRVRSGRVTSGQPMSETWHVNRGWYPRGNKAVLTDEQLNGGFPLFDLNQAAVDSGRNMNEISWSYDTVDCSHPCMDSLYWSFWYDRRSGHSGILEYWKYVYLSRWPSYRGHHWHRDGDSKGLKSMITDEIHRFTTLAALALRGGCYDKDIKWAYQKIPVNNLNVMDAKVLCWLVYKKMGYYDKDYNFSAMIATILDRDRHDKRENGKIPHFQFIISYDETLRGSHRGTSQYWDARVHGLRAIQGFLDITSAYICWRYVYVEIDADFCREFPYAFHRTTWYEFKAHARHPFKKNKPYGILIMGLVTSGRAFVHFGLGSESCVVYYAKPPRHHVEKKQIEVAYDMRLLLETCRAKNQTIFGYITAAKTVMLPMAYPDAIDTITAIENNDAKVSKDMGQYVHGCFKSLGWVDKQNYKKLPLANRLYTSPNFTVVGFVVWNAYSREPSPFFPRGMRIVLTNRSYTEKAYTKAEYPQFEYTENFGLRIWTCPECWNAHPYSALVCLNNKCFDRLGANVFPIFRNAFTGGFHVPIIQKSFDQYMCHFPSQDLCAEGYPIVPNFSWIGIEPHRDMTAEAAACMVAVCCQDFHKDRCRIGERNSHNTAPALVAKAILSTVTAFVQRMNHEQFEQFQRMLKERVREKFPSQMGMITNPHLQNTMLHGFTLEFCFRAMNHRNNHVVHKHLMHLFESFKSPVVHVDKPTVDPQIRFQMEATPNLKVVHNTFRNLENLRMTPDNLLQHMAWSKEWPDAVRCITSVIQATIRYILRAFCNSQDKYEHEKQMQYADIGLLPFVSKRFPNTRFAPPNIDKQYVPHDVDKWFQCIPNVRELLKIHWRVVQPYEGMRLLCLLYTYTINVTWKVLRQKAEDGIYCNDPKRFQGQCGYSAGNGESDEQATRAYYDYLFHANNITNQIVYEITGLTPTPRLGMRVGPKTKHGYARNVDLKRIDYRQLRHPNHIMEFVWIQLVDMENHENENKTKMHDRLYHDFICPVTTAGTLTYDSNELICLEQLHELMDILRNTKDHELPEIIQPWRKPAPCELCISISDFEGKKKLVPSRMQCENWFCYNRHNDSMCAHHAQMPEQRFCYHCFVNMDFMMPEEQDIDDDRRYTGCILCQRELAAPVVAYCLQTKTIIVMICAPCYDQNASVLPRLMQMRKHYVQYNPVMGGSDESKWTECPHTCSGWCGDRNCQLPCMYKGNHKWESETKVQKVCWCGHRADDPMSVDADDTTRAIMPLKDIQEMRERIRFRWCERFGLVPLMHFCEYCDPKVEPRLIQGGPPNPPSSSLSEHPLMN